MAEGKRSRRDRSRSRSRDRHRQRDRERERDRRERSRDHDSDSRRDSRHSERHRSERRERSWDRGKGRDHDDGARGHQSDGAGVAERAQGAYARTFTSAGRAFEDNGGLPGLQRDERRSPPRPGPDADRRWRDGGARPRSAYEAGISAGLDGDYNPLDDGYDSEPRRWRGRSHDSAAPTNTLFVRGIPDGRYEEDLAAVFAAWPGFREARLSRERGSGSSKGFGFVEFDSSEAAAAVMEAEYADGFHLDGSRLRLEYSASQRPTGGGFGGGGGGGGGNAAAVMDWVCDRCSTTNFARRLECHNCSTPRPANPRRVAAEMEAPSHILKLSNLDPMVTADTIGATVETVAPVLDVRIVNDKFTGQPRGFAFVHFVSIADATRALHAFNNKVVPEVQKQPWRLCYARDKAQPPPSAAATAGADALQAAQAMQQYSGWAPKEFDEAALAAGAAASGSAQRLHGGATATDGAPQQQQDQQQDQQQQQRPAPNPSTFVYDPTTGYQYDSTTGLYHDANTGFFYDSNAQIWLSYDYQTGQYAPAGGTAGHQPEPHTEQRAQQTAGGGPGASYYEMPAASSANPGAHGEPENGTSARSQPAAAPAGHVGPQPAAAAKPTVAKRRVATIGSKPQLNPEAVAAAARAAEVEKLRQEKLRLAEELRQKKAALKAKAMQKPKMNAPATGAGPTASGAGVQGVIHRGKWAPKPS